MTARPIGQALAALCVLYALYASYDMVDRNRGAHLLDVFRPHVAVQVVRGLFHIAVTLALCALAVEHLIQ